MLKPFTGFWIMFFFCFAKRVLMNTEQKALSYKETTLTGQFLWKLYILFWLFPQSTVSLDLNNNDSDLNKTFFNPFPYQSFFMFRKFTLLISAVKSSIYNEVIYIPLTGNIPYTSFNSEWSCLKHGTSFFTTTKALVARSGVTGNANALTADVRGACAL